MSNDTVKKPYWRAYHYSADPFAEKSPESFFVSSTWNEYLDLLPQFLRYCNSLVIIDGQAGVGKTSLVNLFISENNGDANIVFIDANECSSREVLLQLLHQHFSAPYDPESTADLSDQIETQLNELKLNKHPRMLIIDNAHNLPLDVRQACLQITQQQTSLETCLPIILVGNETLEQHFKALLTTKTAQSSLHIMSLPAFSLADTEEYLQSCLEKVGAPKDHSPFSHEDVETIYNASQGVVEKINQSAQNSLTVKLEQKTTTHTIPKKLIWWAITLLAIIGLLFLYRTVSQPPALTTTFSTPIALRNPKPVTQPATTQVGNMIVQSAAPAVVTPQAPLPKVSQPKPAPTTIKAESIKPAPIKTAPVQIATPNPPKAKATPRASKPTSTKPDLFNQVMQQKLTLEHKRVLEINAKHYTLQLMASKNLHAVEKFIVQHQLQSTAMVVKITHNKSALFVVLYGTFANRQQAIDNLQLINPQLQRLKPWPRSYGSIHQAMK